MLKIVPPDQFRKDLKQLRNSVKSLLLFSFSLLALSALLSLCARKIPGFAQAYSVHIYAVSESLFGQLWGLLPFSASEIGLYALIVLCLFWLLRFWRYPLILLSRLLLTASCLLFIFTINCGINYYRTPFSTEAGFVIGPSSAQQLYELCDLLTVQINQCVTELKQLPPNEALKLPAGQTEASPALSFHTLRSLGKTGQRSMNNLGAQYPQLSGPYPYPKPMITSFWLSVQQLCGIYSPFTIEANYNRHMPYYNIPHTICHELSHLKGYMREDEANFIGYLACISSDSSYFRYSGYLTGWVYAGNALARADMEGYQSLYKKLAPEAAADLRCNNAFWSQYEGAAAEAASQINDTYLKAHSQADGIQSYGRMVDLMLAYYGDRSAPPQPERSGSRK